MASIERQLQLCLNKIQDWADNNGFKFSKSKTTGVHFCQKRKHHNDPDLKLNGIPIKIVKEFKFLGVIFDSVNYPLFRILRCLKPNVPRPLTF